MYGSGEDGTNKSALVRWENKKGVQMHNYLDYLSIFVAVDVLEGAIFIGFEINVLMRS